MHACAGVYMDAANSRPPIFREYKNKQNNRALEGHKADPQAATSNPPGARPGRRGDLRGKVRLRFVGLYQLRPTPGWSRAGLGLSGPGPEPSLRKRSIVLVARTGTCSDTPIHTRQWLGYLLHRPTFCQIRAFKGSSGPIARAPLARCDNRGWGFRAAPGPLSCMP